MHVVYRLFSEHSSDLSNYRYGYDNNTVENTRYYIHTDHLGSYCTLTNAAKQVVQRNFFDPWGNSIALLRGLPPDDPQAQEQPTLNFTLTPRGFTGHEHYPRFNIINMNGRLYDPVIGRFFSPDKYVANSSFTQDFNRYSYARNCPLMYTDPSGEFAWFVPLIAIGVSAAIAATTYTVQVACMPGRIQQNWDWGQFAFNTMFGAVSGAFSCGVGAVVSTSLAMGAAGLAGFWGGAISGGVAGLITGTMNGVVNYSMSGNQNVIWKSALIGAGTGFIVGGLMGGAQAKHEGKSYWKGWEYNNETLAMSGASDLPPLGQKINSDCGPTVVEWIDKTYSGEITSGQIMQETSKNLKKLAENLKDGFNDKSIWDAYQKLSGHTYKRFIPNSDELERLLTNMQNGNRVALTLSNYHEVAMRSIVKETITKANGRNIENILYNVMDPWKGEYYSIPTFEIFDAKFIFYIK